MHLGRDAQLTCCVVASGLRDHVVRQHSVSPASLACATCVVLMTPEHKVNLRLADFLQDAQ